VSSCFLRATCVWQFGNLDFSTLAQALTPTLPQQLIHRRVDRFWFADYGGTDFSNFTREIEKGAVGGSMKFSAHFGIGKGRAARDSATRQIFGEVSHLCVEQLEQGIREAAPYMKNYSAIHAAADPSRKLTNRDIVLDMERGFIIVGDPQRCIDTIRRWQEEVGLTTFSFTFHFGGMPQEMALKNIRLFAERVMPALDGV
jgi:hypothetical protein